MRYFGFLFFIFVSIEAFAIEEKSCPTYDNSKNFSPVRDQGQRGFCHAFTAARLFEEASCLQKKSTCGKPVSPLSIARWTTDIMSTNPSEDGWYTSEDVVAGLKLGVCPEKSYSYARYQDAVKGNLKDCPVDRNLSSTQQARQIKNLFIQASVSECNKTLMQFPQLHYQSDRFGTGLTCQNAHALIVKGMTWKDGRCQLDLLNSWGEQANLQGFYDAETFLSGTRELTSLRKKKTGESVDGLTGAKPTEHSSEQILKQKQIAFDILKATLKNGSSVAASVCLDNLPARTTQSERRRSSDIPEKQTRSQIPSEEVLNDLTRTINWYDEIGINKNKAGNEKNYKHYAATKAALPCISKFKNTSKSFDKTSLDLFFAANVNCKQPLENLANVYTELRYLGLPNTISEIINSRSGK